MGIFHYRNWLKKKNQSSTSSHNSQMTISQMRKILLSWMIPIFYKNYQSPKVPSRIGVSAHAINQIQHGLSLHLPSSPKFEQEPLGLIQLQNSTYKMLYSVMTCYYVSIPALISEFCHNCHRISIIGVIDVINVRGIHLALPLPCKLQSIPNYTYEVYGQVY